MEFREFSPGENARAMPNDASTSEFNEEAADGLGELVSIRSDRFSPIKRPRGHARADSACSTDGCVEAVARAIAPRSKSSREGRARGTRLAAVETRERGRLTTSARPMRRHRRAGS